VSKIQVLEVLEVFDAFEVFEVFETVMKAEASVNSVVFLAVSSFSTFFLSLYSPVEDSTSTSSFVPFIICNFD
jgi:hypothetical protein